MSNQASYTQQEWSAIVNAPMTAAAGVVVADFGIVSFAKEIRAASSFIQEAKTRYAGNELVGAVADAVSVAQTDDADLPTQEQALVQLQEAVATVARKSPAELEQFKHFILGLADHVANAAGEGLFGTGEAVSASERSFLDELKRVLEA